MSVAMMDTMGVLNRIKFEQLELVKAAESVLVAMANDPRSVDPEDRIVFTWLGWDERKIARELGRVQALRQWKPKAGSNVEYAESAEMHAALSKSVPKKVADLQAKRDEIQGKMDDENIKLAQAQSRLDGMDHARKMLRDLVPAHVRKRFDDELSVIRSGPSAERLRTVRGRRDMILDVLERLSSVNADTDQEIRLHANAAGLQGILPEPSSCIEFRRLNERPWVSYLDQLRAELPSLEAELLDLTTTIDEQLADAETILDHYILEAK